MAAFLNTPFTGSSGEMAVPLISCREMASFGNKVFSPGAWKISLKTELIRWES